MQKLTAPTVVDDEVPARTFYAVTSETVEQLAEEVTPTSRYFAFFLAVDGSTLSNEAIFDIADKLLRSGLVYFCVWGPDCERVHDLFDEQDIEVHPDLPGNDDVVMTTWHSKQTLEDALWFFANSAYPTGGYEKECTEWIAASVANNEWAEAIRIQLPRAARCEYLPKD